MPKRAASQLPDAFAGREVSAAAKDVAASLSAGEVRVVLLGNLAVQHPDFAQIQAAAQWIADNTGATLGFLTEGANSVGAHLVDALPGEGGLNAREVFEQPRKGYVLLNAEPEFDTANPAQAIAALKAAEMVVVMSPFRHGMDYADVLLPIAPFTETSGTFVNAEGTAQSFNGVVRALGDTRPGWKVLRVLGTILGLPGFEFDTAEEVRIAALGTGDLSCASVEQDDGAGEARGIERRAERQRPAASRRCADLSRRCARAPRAVAASDGGRTRRERRRPADRALRQARPEGRRSSAYQAKAICR